jgi:phage replication O-like protein O
MEALCKTCIPGEQRQVLDSILRMTYGWHKCEDHISLQQLAELTMMKKRNVIRALKKLSEKKMVLVLERGNGRGKTNLLKFNKNYDEWQTSKIEETVSMQTPFNNEINSGQVDTLSGGQVDTLSALYPYKKEKKERRTCPHEEIIESYNSILGSHLPVVKIKLWHGTTRAKNLLARWAEDEARRNNGFWPGLFEYVRDKCPFLLGENNQQWKADLEWILKKNNFVKILEGKYERR